MFPSGKNFWPVFRSNGSRALKDVPSRHVQWVSPIRYHFYQDESSKFRRILIFQYTSSIKHMHIKSISQEIYRECELIN